MQHKKTGATVGVGGKLGRAIHRPVGFLFRGGEKIDLIA
jgi:hypothetical protein